MSKIIDVLNRRIRPRGKAVGSIQEELAKTFFSSSAKKDKKAKKRSKIPWVITALTLCLVFFVVMSRTDINIEIRRKASAVRLTENNPFFIKGGKLSNHFVKSIYFSGDAARFSRKKDDMIILVNSKGSGWANFTIELKEPVNMERLDISYAARGQVGGERLLLVLADADNKIYRMAKDLSLPLTEDWQEYTINLKPARGSVGLESMSKIKFEFGSLTTGNNHSATVFLKDIYVRK